MPRDLKNIARCTVVGFLLLAISGLTIAIHHEHLVVGMLTEHGHEHHDGIAVRNTPSTYHEIHFVKLLSGDSFSGSQKIEYKNSPTKLFVVYSNLFELPKIQHSTSFAPIDIKETSPPSRDKCVLFCSFLI
jgi:hypothetical protein